MGVVVSKPETGVVARLGRYRRSDSASSRKNTDLLLVRSGRRRRRDEGSGNSSWKGY